MTTKEREELLRLKWEVKRPRLEWDMQKEASARFATEHGSIRGEGSGS